MMKLETNHCIFLCMDVHFFSLWNGSCTAYKSIDVVTRVSYYGIHPLPTLAFSSDGILFYFIASNHILLDQKWDQTKCLHVYVYSLQPFHPFNYRKQILGPDICIHHDLWPKLTIFRRIMIHVCSLIWSIAHAIEYTIEACLKRRIKCCASNFYSTNNL